MCRQNKMLETSRIERCCISCWKNCVDLFLVSIRIFFMDTRSALVDRTVQRNCFKDTSDICEPSFLRFSANHATRLIAFPLLQLNLNTRRLLGVAS